MAAGKNKLTACKDQNVPPSHLPFLFLRGGNATCYLLKPWPARFGKFPISMYSMASKRQFDWSLWKNG